MPYRRWTRLGIVAVASHLGYELAVGVGVPGAPRIGVRPAVAGYALATAGAYRTAGRLPGPRGDRRFAAANGLFAAAVISHYASWPRATWHGLPWLLECEGIEGVLIVPYNMVLQVSAVAVVGGLVENLSAWPWALARGRPRRRTGTALADTARVRPSAGASGRPAGLVEPAAGNPDAKRQLRRHGHRQIPSSHGRHGS